MNKPVVRFEINKLKIKVKLSEVEVHINQYSTTLRMSNNDLKNQTAPYVTALIKIMIGNNLCNPMFAFTEKVSYF